jgi:hypothetical protein
MDWRCRRQHWGGFTVKKTIAAGGASLLGLGAAATFGAAPAAAAPVTELCDDYTEHNITVGTLGDNWFMNCIPRYAVAEVLFPIVSDTPFPDDFLPLDDPGVTRTTSGGAAADSYFASAEQGFTFLDFIPALSDETTQTYDGNLIVPVASVEAASVADLPGLCGTDYDTVYRVNYGTASVTFTQIVDGVEWRYDVETTPGPLYLGLNILGTGVLDPDANQCVTSNDIVNFAENDDSSVWGEIVPVVTATTDTLQANYGSGKNLPDVSRYVPPVPEKPLLPATGSDLQPAVPVGIAALFLSLGVAAGVLRRRRAGEVTD